MSSSPIETRDQTATQVKLFYGPSSVIRCAVRRNTHLKSGSPVALLVVGGAHGSGSKVVFATDGRAVDILEPVAFDPGQAVGAPVAFEDIV